MGAGLLTHRHTARHIPSTRKKLILKQSTFHIIRHSIVVYRTRYIGYCNVRCIILFLSSVARSVSNQYNHTVLLFSCYHLPAATIIIIIWRVGYVSGWFYYLDEQLSYPFRYSLSSLYLHSILSVYSSLFPSITFYLNFFFLKHGSGKKYH